MKLEERKNYPWILVVCYSLLGVCFPAAVTQFSMVVDTLAAQMNLPQQTIMMADSLRAVCLVTAMFCSSFVYRKLGLHKTLILGLFFQISPQFLIPLAVRLNSLPLLFIFKGMQGFNSVAFPLYIYTITSWMSSRYKGLATAIFNGSFTAGAGMGAWVSGRLIPTFGWKATFYATGLVPLILAIPALLVTREKPLTGVKVAKKSAIKNDLFAQIIKSPVTWTLVGILLANTWIGQSVTVDMPIYAKFLNYSDEQRGSLMLIISLLTVVSSIAAGGFSDYVASRSASPLKARTRILAAGYLVSLVAAIALPILAPRHFGGIAVTASLLMIGASWAQGVFWALPSEVYTQEENVVATSICSGASNLVNPVAPFVVGILLGSNGAWTAAWLTCSIMAGISIINAFGLPGVIRKCRHRSSKIESEVQ